MKKEIFTGAATALVTPFRATDNKNAASGFEVDFDRFGKLVDSQLKSGIDALLVCGTTGESPTLSHNEHLECMRFVIDRVGGRVPVIAGTGSNDTAYSVELSADAASMGADALLLVSPYYNKTTQKGLVQHFLAVANHVDLPIILYNIPGRTNLNISLPTLVELAKHDNIVAVKECTGDPSFTGRIVKETDLTVYSGEDGLVVPLMSYGAKGVISVVSNILPAEVHEMCERALASYFKTAREIQSAMLGLIDALFAEVNPIPVKAALTLMEQSAGGVRLPLVPAEHKTVELLHRELAKLGLIENKECSIVDLIRCGRVVM